MNNLDLGFKVARYREKDIAHTIYSVVITCQWSSRPCVYFYVEDKLLT